MKKNEGKQEANKKKASRVMAKGLAIAMQFREVAEGVGEEKYKIRGTRWGK